MNGEVKWRACVWSRAQEEEGMHPCRDVSSACDGKSVLAAGAVRKSADVGLVDVLQERAVTLKNTRIC